MIKDLDQINWQLMKSLKCVKSGPSGVFYAGFGLPGNHLGTAVVIKSCPEPVNSLYTHLVLEKLRMFKLPKMRIIHHKQKEYKEM
jgi:hypothetical protein